MMNLTDEQKEQLETLHRMATSAPDASDGDLYKESYVEGLRGQYQAAVEEAAELRAELAAARADITKLEKEADDVRQQAIEDIAAAQRETDEERAQVISLAHEDAALREAIRRFLTAYDDTSLGLPAELDGFVALARLVGYKPINNTLQRLCPELVEPAPAALLAGDTDAGDRATETTCPACGEPTYPAFVGERWCEACQCLVNNTPEIGEAS